MNEHPPEPYGSAVHEHEVSRHHHRSPCFQRLMHTEGLLSSIVGGLDAAGNGPHSIFHQRAVDEPGPNVQNIDEFFGEALEAPGLIGMHDKRLIAALQAAIKIDHTFHKSSRKNPDASVVEEIEATRLPLLRKNRVVPQMRIAMNYPVTAERLPPRPEQIGSNGIAVLERM